MLRSLTLKNFRGFREHRIDFGREVILIGKNNAGKTTIIEALRVLSVCQSRASGAAFIACPSWLDTHCSGPGFRPSLETIDFDFSNVQHSYNVDSPAIIKAKLTNGNEVAIFIGRNASELFCQLRIKGREAVHNRNLMKANNFGVTKVMPPIGSLLPREKVIAKDRLNRYIDGYLSYRHFRNQLYERSPDFIIFRALLEQTWAGIRIEHFENDHGEANNEYSLLVREGRFTSEISWHGHGLQAWMQTVWFLARSKRNSTIVLDEPDVYLHADLQRKLIKTIESLKFRQVIVATHSSEIISDVPFQNVIVVKKADQISRSAKNAAAIQEALRSMGSIHSIQLSKLADRGLLLLVEGDDGAFLGEVAYKLGASNFDSFSEIAVQEIEGSGNWHKALGAAMALAKASSGEVETVLLLDSDYFGSENHESKYRLAKEYSLNLKIWDRKEIENYFINSKVIARFIKDRSGDNFDPTEDVIDSMIAECALSLRVELIENIATEMQSSTRGLSVKSAMEKARGRLCELETEGYNLCDLVSGKKLLSLLSGRCKDAFGVSFSPLSICKEAQIGEIPVEMVNFVENICKRRKA